MAVALLGIALFGFASTKQDSNIKSTLEAPCEEVKFDTTFGPSYQGKLIDTHIHVPPNSIKDFRKLICTFNLEGTSKTFAFFPIFSLEDEEQFELAKITMEKYGDLFVPFIMPPDRDDRADGFPTVPADVLERMLVKTDELFKGYGEIGLYERGDNGGPKGAPALPPDSKRLTEIYPIIREHNLIVYFHLGEGQQKSFESTAAAHRDINFIFHGDQLVVYRDGIQDLSALDEILYRNPNVYYGVDELYGDDWILKPEVSKEEFLAHFENYEELLDEDVETWKSFIERHPHQVLWGTDRGWFGGWAVDPEVGLTLTRYARAFINRLDPSVQELYAHKNAERLLSM